MRTILSLLIVFSILTQMGCNQGSNQTGLVAVVDLDQVAAALGRDAAIEAAVKRREADLTQQVAGAKSSYEKQLLETKSKLGEKPNKQQTQQLANLQKQANQQLTQVARQAQGNVAELRQQLILQFRNEAKTVARQVAQEKGLSIVVTRNDSVILVHDAAADITSDVTQRMQTMAISSNTQATPPPFARTAAVPDQQIRR